MDISVSEALRGGGGGLEGRAEIGLQSSELGLTTHVKMGHSTGCNKKCNANVYRIYIQVSLLSNTYFSYLFISLVFALHYMLHCGSRYGPSRLALMIVIIIQDYFQCGTPSQAVHLKKVRLYKRSKFSQYTSAAMRVISTSVRYN